MKERELEDRLIETLAALHLGIGLRILLRCLQYRLTLAQRILR